MAHGRTLISNGNPMEAIEARKAYCRDVNPEWLVEIEVDAVVSE